VSTDGKTVEVTWDDTTRSTVPIATNDVALIGKSFSQFGRVRSKAISFPFLLFPLCTERQGVDASIVLGARACG
jgi:hypothetical protein